MRKVEKATGNKGKTACRVLAVLLCFVLAGGLLWSNLVPSVEAQTKWTVADNVTLNPDSTSLNYKQNTKNVGRIWTDKSVSADTINLHFGAAAGTTVSKTAGSDFLVALSAMSSTSTLSHTTTVPLDIVLVLDVSGSMSDNLSTTYIETYDVVFDGYNNNDADNAYYILNSNGTYQQVRRNSEYNDNWEREYYWYYGNRNQIKVIPMTSAEDTDTTHVQFYTMKGTSKMDALKTAVNGFIDATSKLNEELPAGTPQHQIGLVKFAGDVSNTVGNTLESNGVYNHTQIVENLTTNLAEVRREFNNINAGGATRAADGLEHAKTVLNGARENAQKVVLFFTDGKPNQGSGFSNAVASDAVSKAKELKDAQTLIYTVGVFSDADASDLPTNTQTEQNPSANKQKFNYYLHGVSSNFPGATARSDSGFRITLGAREADSDYYKVATEAVQLNNIFQEILEEVSSPLLAPTVVENNDAYTSGYVTFRDELGEFMEVKDFNGVYINGVDYTTGWYKQEGTAAGVTVWTNKGSTSADNAPNHVYPGAHALSALRVTVTKGANGSGDTVVVDIPAALLPLRQYDVDKDAGTLTIDEAQPIRVFYSVGLQEGVDEAMTSGNFETVPGLANYVQSHTFHNQTHFYANDWAYTADINGLPAQGGTTSSFTPALSNSFYYYTENTPIYRVADGVTTPDLANDAHFTPIKESEQPKDVGDVFYYKYAHYSVEQGENQVLSNYAQVSFVPPADGTGENRFGTDSAGNVYIKAGTPKIKLSNAENFRVDKPTQAEMPEDAVHEGDNVTQTATYAMYPAWSGGNSENYLGNNGRVSYRSTGALDITKIVTSPAGVTAPEGKLFTMQVTLTNADPEVTLAGTYSAKVHTLNVATDTTLSVPFADDGKGNIVGTVNITGAQHVTLYGLPAGTQYTVTELVDGTKLELNGAAKSGFTQTVATGTTGTITVGTTQNVSFTNHYNVAPTNLTAPFAIVKRVEDASKKEMEWQEDWSFQFIIRADSLRDIPMPAGSTEIDGVLTKLVTIDANTAAHRLENVFADVTYTVPGTYTYSIAEVMLDSEGLPGINYSGAEYDLTVVATDNGDGTMSVVPTLTWQLKDNGDTAGDAAATDAIFTNVYDLSSATASPVAMKVYTDYTGATTTATVAPFQFAVEAITPGAPAVGNAVNGVTTVQNLADGAIPFGSATFTHEHVGHTYTYRIHEVIPATPVVGMTYDRSVYEVDVTVTDAKTAADKDTVVVNAAYYRLDANGNRITGEGAFVLPADRTLVFTNSYDAVEDAKVTLNVQKTISGRNWMTSDSFDFILTSDPDATVEHPMPAGSSSAGGLTTTTTTTTTTGAFGEITFDKVGSYTYFINEVIPTGDKALGGMTYDTHYAEVNVNVTLNTTTGKLEAAVTYDNSLALTDADQAVTTAAAFTNTYKAAEVTMTPAAIHVTKTLEGRSWQTGDNFTARLIPATETTPAPNSRVISFNQGNHDRTLSFDDNRQLVFEAAGTYTYYIIEDTGSIGGITYDRSVWKFDVDIVDPGDGQLVVASQTFSKATVPAGLALNATTTATQLAPKSEENPNGLVYEVQTGATAAALVNKYQAAAVTVSNIGGYKTLLGRNSYAEETFAFTLEPKSEGFGTKYIYDTNDFSASVGGLTEGVKAAFNFGAITFNEVGTYTFTMQETPGLAEDTTYDGSIYTVTVTVTDPGDGRLQARVAYAKDGDVPEANFVNHYYDYQQAKDVVDENNTSIDGKNVTASQVLTYNIHWENTKNEPADVTISDTIPANTTLVENSISEGGVNTAGTIEWNFTNVAPHERVEVSFQVTVNDTYGGAELKNKARISSNDTNVVINYLPGKSVVNNTAAVTGRTDVQVGDTLTYTIHYRNDKAKAGTVTISDTLHEALDFVTTGTEANTTADGGRYDPATRTISWEKNTAANTDGYVSFTVKVNEKALTNGPTNRATIDNKYTTNVVTLPSAEKSTLTITKRVESTVAGVTPPTPAGGYFRFQVDLQDANGKKLDGTYYYDGELSGTTNVPIQSGGTLTIAPGGSVVIKGLPVGATYTITELDIPAGYKQTSPANGAKAVGTITATAENNRADFVNTFTPATLSGATNLMVSKQVVDQRPDAARTTFVEWKDNWNFQFNLRRENAGDTSSPLPAQTSVTISAADAVRTKSFGDIYFTRPGTYTYVITESRTPNIPGLTYSFAAYSVTVQVTADTNGILSATSTMEKINEDDNTVPTTPVAQPNNTALFTNLYQLTSDIWTPTVTKEYINTSLPTETRAAATQPTFEFVMQALRGYKTDDVNTTVNVPGIGANKLSEVTGHNAPSGHVLFDSVTFVTTDEGNTYEYLIYEKNTQKPGMTYDDKYYVARVVVASEEGAVAHTVDYFTADQYGNIIASVDAVNFSNTYDPTDVQVDIKVQKTIKGRDWLDGEKFTFTLNPTTPETPAPGEAADGTKTSIEVEKTDLLANSTNIAQKSFGTITYDKVGEYIYRVLEVAPSTPAGGMSYDTHEHYVLVSVTDDGTGVLQDEVKYFASQQALSDYYNQVPGAAPDTADFAAFVNTYTTGTTTLPATALNVTKALEGRAWREGDSFEFTLTPAVSAAPMPSKNSIVIGTDTTKTQSFGSVTYGAAGTYVYTVKENTAPDPKIPGVTYDTTEYTVTVVVTDDNAGNLVIDSVNGVKYAVGEVPASAITFTNTYLAASTSDTINVTKTLNGREWTDDAFTFTLTALNGAPVPANTTATVTKSSQTATFGAINFTQVGTYVYQVKEQPGNATNMIYDGHTATVTVTVTDDNATGKLVPSVSYDNGGTAAQFTNVYYEAEKTVYKAGDLTTKIDGHYVTPGETLTYAIDWANTSGSVADVVIIDTIPGGTTVVPNSTVLIGHDGVVNKQFINGTATWTLKNAPIGANGTLQFNVTVDQPTTDAVVLRNEAKVNELYNTNTVENYVSAKSVVNESGVAPDAPKLGEKLTYTIEFYQKANTAMTIEDKLSENLTFLPAVEGENTTADGGVYDETAHTITWTIPAAAEGAMKSVSFQAKLNANALGAETGNVAVVNGVKTNETTIPVIANKNLTISKTVVLTPDQGTIIDTAKEFTFLVKLTDDSGSPLQRTYHYTVNGGAEQELVLTEGIGLLTLKHGDTALLKALPSGARYTVTEVVPDGAGGYQAGTPGGYTSNFTGDTTSGTVDSDPTVAFENEYAVEAVTDLQLNATKTLTGPVGTTLHGKTFHFVVSKSANSYADNEVVATATSDPSTAMVETATSGDNGTISTNVTFTKMSFTAAGEYTYYIHELRGLADNITYDYTVYAVTIKVVDDGAGKLVVPAEGGIVYKKLDGSPATGENGIPVFHNTFIPGKVMVSVDLKVDKNVADWSGETSFWADKFNFGLYTDNDGQPGDLVATGSNNVNGHVIFTNVSATSMEEEVTEAVEVFTVTEDKNVFVAMNDTAVPLTADELHQVTKGSTLTFNVTVAEATATDAVKALTLSAEKKIGEAEATPVTTLAEQMKVTFTGLEAGNYQVVVDGKTEPLADLDGDGNTTVTILTDSFGTFTIVKVENNTASTTTTVSTESTESVAPAEPGEAPAAGETPVTGDVPVAGEPAVSEEAPVAGEPTVAAELAGSVAATAEPVVTTAEPALASVEPTVPTEPTVVPVPQVEPVAALTGSNFNQTYQVRKYTFEADKVGDYTFHIREIKGDPLGGVTYSQALYKIVIKVGLDENEVLKVDSVTYYEVGELDTATTTPMFINGYHADPTDPVTITASKTLVGRDLQDGEFTFLLLNKADGTEVKRTTNVGNNIKFELGAYEAAGVYEYVVKELQGDDTQVSYDVGTFDVTVTVTDDGSGKLKADVTAEPNGSIAFTNYYIVPVDFTLPSVTKTLTGRDMREGEFTFQVLDKEGNVLATGKNAAAKNGEKAAVTFDNIIFHTAGTYELSVVEVNGNAARTKYDDTVYNLTVSVTMDAAYKLQAQVVDGPDGEMHFANTYKRPSKPVESAETGDNSMMGLMGAMMVMSAAGVVVLTSRKRRTAR